MKTLHAKIFDNNYNDFGPSRTRNITVSGDTVNVEVKDSMFVITSTHKVRVPIENVRISPPVNQYTYTIIPAAPTPAYRDEVRKNVRAVRLSDLIEYTIE